MLICVGALHLEIKNMALESACMGARAPVNWGKFQIINEKYLLSPVCSSF